MSATAQQISVGVDLGGTNMRVAIFDDLSPGTSPTPLAMRKVPVGDDRDPASITARLASLIGDLLDEIGQPDAAIPIGIGVAAMLRDTDGVVANSPHLGWRDVAFGELIRGAMPHHEIHIYNDVDAITYGEYMLGAGMGARDVLAVFVGTGIGGGIISDGALLRGAHNCAAEIGHTKVVWGAAAAPCACGLRGCVEAYVGGSYLQRRARAELRGGARSAAVRLAGGIEHVTPGHLDQAAADGDEYALALLTEIAPLLGVVLANAITLLNPARVILGGGVLSRTPLLREQVVTSLEIAVNPPARDGLTICDSALGDEAGLVGSALLAGGPLSALPSSAG